MNKIYLLFTCFILAFFSLNGQSHINPSKGFEANIILTDHTNFDVFDVTDEYFYTNTGTDVYIYNLETSAQIYSFTKPDDYTTTTYPSFIYPTSDGKKLWVGFTAGSNVDDRIYCIDIASGTWEHKATFPANFELEMLDGHFLISGTNSTNWNDPNSVYLLDTSGSNNHSKIIEIKGSSAGIAIDSDGNIYNGTNKYGETNSIYKWNYEDVVAIIEDETKVALTISDAEKLSDIPSGGAYDCDLDINNTLLISYNNYPQSEYNLAKWNGNKGDGNNLHSIATLTSSICNVKARGDITAYTDNNDIIVSSFDKNIGIITHSPIQKNILFVNGGQFQNGSFPTTFKTYLPNDKQTTTISDNLEDATSVQDMIVDGNYAFISADYNIFRYNMVTRKCEATRYTQDTSETEADGNGKEGAGVNHKLAIYENLLLATRQRSSYPPEDGYNVRVYNKGDLSLVKKIAVSDQATDIAIYQDKAYVIINGGFAGTKSSLAIINLKTLTLENELNLNTDGLGVMQLILHEEKLYGVRLNSAVPGAYSSGIFIFDCNTQDVSTIDYVAGVPYDSSPLAIEPLTSNTLFVKKDLGYVTFDVQAQTFGSEIHFPIPSSLTQSTDYIGRGSAYDPEDEMYYIAYGYWHGNGVGVIYDNSYNSVGTFEGVGPSPEVLKVCNLNITNTPPEVNSSSLSSSVKALQDFEIELPEDIFLDEEDGILSTFLTNKNELEWLSFNRATHTLSGKYPNSLKSNISVDIKLQAFDEYGCSANTIYNLNIEPGIPTSIDNNTSSDVSIYPNPAQHFFRINSGDNDVKSVYVYNMYGALVIERNNIANNDLIELNNLPAGEYLVKILTTEKVIVKPIIKQ